MNGRRTVAAGILCVLLLAGCSAPSSTDSIDPSSAPAVLGAGEQLLEAGTYRMEPSQVLGGAPYPAFHVTVPEGWTSVDGWVLSRGPVAILLWNVDQVFGHPCQWKGTAVTPGGSVEDLVAALVEVPLRNPTTPEPVEIDGRVGTYFEWSVPADIAYDGEGFPDCDAKTGEPHDFVSWTGIGKPSTRYHQGPGEIDRIWVLDADGQRLVIDAFAMPDATAEQIAEIHDIIGSIRFIDE